MSSDVTHKPGEAPPLPPTPGTSTSDVFPANAHSRIRPETNPSAAFFAVSGVRSELVGRQTELEQMAEAISHAIDFQAPQLVTVVGNQGTGKTRLVAELVTRVVIPPMRVFSGRAVEGGPRYGAIASFLRNRFRISEGETDDRVLKSFKEEVERVFGDDRVDEVLHFLGGFLDLHFPDSPFLRVLNENPDQHDEIARTVLRRFLEVDAQTSPLLLVFDGLQWADDETLAALNELGAGLGGSPVVLVACARPEMLVHHGDWGSGATDHIRIDLRNLEPDDAEAMLEHLLSRCESVPEDIIDDAVEQTGGNPYFLEQLVRLFLSNGTITTEGDKWTLDPDRAMDTELPISIEEAIEARIANLETEERDLLEKGVVFGNVFWTGAIVALTRVEQSTAHTRTSEEPPPPPTAPLEYRWTTEDPTRRKVEQIIEELVEQDYLLKLDPEDSTIPDDTELVFKHNLERELVLNSTEQGKQKRFYRVAAQWLETNLAGRSEEQLEFLGQLYERGGDKRRAAHCYLSGGDKARTRYANEEAVRLYTAGLEMIIDDDALARLSALHNLGDVLDLTGRTEQALEKFTEMLRYAWLYDLGAKAGAAHSRLGRIYRRRGEYDRAMQHLREANQLFTNAKDSRGIAGTLDDIGRVHWLRGAYGQALEFHRQALSIRRGIGDRRSIALSLANIGRVHHDSGGFKAAIAQFREALDLRRDIGDLSGMVNSLTDLGGVHSEDGNYTMALELFSEARQIAGEIGDKIALADVLYRLGACKSAMGAGQEAVEHLKEAIAVATKLGDRVVLSECSRCLAEVYLSSNNVQAANDHARHALALSEAVGSRVHVGTAHRVLAETVAAGGFSDEERERADEHYRQAVEILAGMKNELELARCYRSFAVFRDRCGLHDDAAKLRKRADEIFGRLRGAASID